MDKVGIVLRALPGRTTSEIAREVGADYTSVAKVLARMHDRNEVICLKGKPVNQKGDRLTKHWHVNPDFLCLHGGEKRI